MVLMTRSLSFGGIVITAPVEGRKSTYPARLLYLILLHHSLSEDIYHWKHKAEPTDTTNGKLYLTRLV